MPYIACIVSVLNIIYKTVPYNHGIVKCTFISKLFLQSYRTACVRVRTISKGSKSVVLATFEICAFILPLYSLNTFEENSVR